MKCTEKQFHVQELIKTEIKFFMSETYIQWGYIIERIEHLKKVKEWCPDEEGEVKDISEWYDPSIYREGATNDEFGEWLKIKASEAMFNTLKSKTESIVEEETLEPITLPEFLETYEDLTKMQLWDFLIYNGHMVAEGEK